VQKHPHFAEGQADYANALAAANRFDEAIAAARRAIDLAPRQPEAYNALGQVYCAAERYDEALAVTLQAVELNPMLHASIGNMGKIYLEMECYDEAIQWFERANLLKPNDADIAPSLFYAYARQLQ